MTGCLAFSLTGLDGDEAAVARQVYDQGVVVS